MPDGTHAITLSLHRSIHDIGESDWNRCAGDDNPFVGFAFLSAIEDSGSAGPRTGWVPRHATLRDAKGRVLAVVPAYLKTHSYGEYVFDWSWARAYESAGGRYYPKWQVAVPFSPVPGPRLLFAPDACGAPASLAGALADACRDMELSSVHLTFCTEAEQEACRSAGWLPRIGLQYHWHNRGYADFDGFLEALASRKRKSIRRERREAESAGYALRVLRGDEITSKHWAAFYRFYLSTSDRKWGSAYLTPRFFPMLGARLGDRVVLMVAEQNGTPVAGALNLLGRDTLYGRNWGTSVRAPFLHFELCYYQAIEFAITHRLARVEAGAQGEHKIARGYEPAFTYSAHWLEHAGLRRAVAEFLERERPGVRAEAEALQAEFSPYKQMPEGCG